MRISDWSSDVCSSDLAVGLVGRVQRVAEAAVERFVEGDDDVFRAFAFEQFEQETGEAVHRIGRPAVGVVELVWHRMPGPEHVQAGVDQVQGRARGRGHARAQPGVQSVSRADASGRSRRSEEHTSELQSLMRISYAVFCLKKQK